MKQSLASRFFFVACLLVAGLAVLALVVPDVSEFVWGPGGVMLAAIAPFPINPDLQALAIAYRNQRLIGDAVLPRVTVGKQEYTYWLWDKQDAFTIPDTSVGRTSAPNQVEFQATEKQSATKDYGLDDPIPNADIENAPDGIDPRSHAAEVLTDLIMLDREVRVANLTFAAATYPASNKVQLSGTSQFSDFTNSDPIGVIEAKLDVPLVRPNIMVVGQAAWSKLRQHPDIIKATNGTAGDKGLASRQAVAELFELEEILVGAAFLNTAKKGQTPTFSRVWGKHISLLFRDVLANPARSGSRVTFGFTAQFGPRIAGSQQDGDIGVRGGERVRVAESVDEHVVAADVGFFIEDAVA
ncbi:MAG: phage capsid protein [Gemmatimonadales bacterium]